MIFNSSAFILFFLIVYTAYLALGKSYKLQNRLLLVASYVFYGYWDWRFLSLILISTGVDYFCGLRLGSGGSGRKRYLVTSVSVNLGLLGIFKYMGFFADSAVDLLRTVGVHADPITLNIVLPVGISFYTFQTLSYTVDIYRGRLEPCRNFLDFALFVAFFPQLVAGPIERALRFLPQITTPRSVEWEKIQEGLWLLAWGYYKKVFIADNVAGIVDTVFGAPSPHGSEVLIGVYAFAIQIYCDFSGYTDIARGLAKLMGFDLILNFNLPYFAKSPSDFWRRWHISLSSWLRDYLYIPLGGNRKGGWMTLRNLFLTMLLGGLWHGAAWTFVVWGIYHGALLIAYRLSPEMPWPEGAVAQKARGVMAVLVMFHFTCLGWLLFRAGSMAQVGNMLKALLVDFRWTVNATALLSSLAGFSALLIGVQFVQYFKDDLLFPIRLPRPALGVAYGVLAYFILMHGAVSDAFIYFQF